uniref:Uncharacterized protein n=1 Tax=Rhodnius prolixus TaxID=13249 RepID=T1HJX0_RHOPR
MNPCPKSKEYPLRKYGYEYHCHPMYKTTSKEYGFYPPNCVSVPFVFKPRQSKFSRTYAMDRTTNTKLNL